MVGSGIPMAVAGRARDMSLLGSLPGISFLLKWQSDLFFVFLFFFKAVEHYTMSVGERR